MEKPVYIQRLEAMGAKYTPIDGIDAWTLPCGAIDYMAHWEGTTYVQGWTETCGVRECPYCGEGD